MQKEHFLRGSKAATHLYRWHRICQRGTPQTHEREVPPVKAPNETKTKWKAAWVPDKAKEHLFQSKQAINIDHISLKDHSVCTKTSISLNTWTPQLTSIEDNLLHRMSSGPQKWVLWRMWHVTAEQRVRCSTHFTHVKAMRKASFPRSPHESLPVANYLMQFLKQISSQGQRYGIPVLAGTKERTMKSSVNEKHG